MPMVSETGGGWTMEWVCDDVAMMMMMMMTMMMMMMMMVRFVLMMTRMMLIVLVMVIVMMRMRMWRMRMMLMMMRNEDDPPHKRTYKIYTRRQKKCESVECVDRVVTYVDLLVSLFLLQPRVRMYAMLTIRSMIV